MKFKSSVLLISTFLLINSALGALISTITLSKSSIQTCDTLVVTLSGTHYCLSDSITGISHSVSGSVINVNITVTTGICIPPTILPPFTTTYKIPMTALSLGTYTVKGYYNSLVSTSTPTVSVVSCCPFSAKVGSDTSLCDVSSIAILGNTPPTGSTFSWTVLSGGGTLGSSTQPSTILSNLSYGSNVVVWTVNDSVCITDDTLTIDNFETPSPVTTEVDRQACYDSTTIKALNPMVGSGTWKSLVSGVFLFTPKKNNCRVGFLTPGIYDFTWTVVNGACIEVDSLKITFDKLTSAPVITASNSELTSSAAPKYQWYKDGNPIPGATNMTYTATSNGLYKVLASVLGCENGLFSNEIDLKHVGVEAIGLASKIHIGPNPSSGLVNLYDVPMNAQIVVLSAEGQELIRTTATSNNLSLDCSKFAHGTYLIKILSNDQIATELLLID